ncbi:MAG: type II toxin-antitoxin system VapC family toxin [Desulfurococcales archaeon]|nr:type II toxin-antitoxin system VapC family toxin [Desulfurococcales archaeon]MCE4627338.1 type II toxin-antitoxin system VapC family toxin [Desulfurococcales archaeon]
MRVFIDANLLIYLNTIKNQSLRTIYEDYYIGLLRTNKLYTNVLVLDELLYISWKKYNVPYKLTIEFIDSIVLPYTTILSLNEDDYRTASKILVDYNLKPSDSLHVASMKNNGIEYIVSEDNDFDRVDGIKRLWIK